MGMKLKWSRRAAWLGLAICLACGLFLIVQVLAAAGNSGKGRGVQFVLVAVGMVAAIAAIVGAENVTRHGRHWTAWLQPRPIAIVALALFFAFGVMADGVALFQPTSASEPRPGYVSERLDEIAGKLTPAPTPAARLMRKVQGVWGDPDCKVRWGVRIEGNGLVLETLKPPAGESHWKMEATVTGVNGERLQTIGQTPREERGRGHAFIYSSDGVTERLTWNIQSQEVSQEWDRCEAPRA